MARGEGIVGWHAHKNPAVVVGAIEAMLDLGRLARTGASRGKPRGVGEHAGKGRGNHSGQDDTAPSPLSTGLHNEKPQR